MSERPSTNTANEFKIVILRQSTTENRGFYLLSEGVGTSIVATENIFPGEPIRYKADGTGMELAKTLNTTRGFFIAVDQRIENKNLQNAYASNDAMFACPAISGDLMNLRIVGGQASISKGQYIGINAAGKFVTLGNVATHAVAQATMASTTSSDDRYVSCLII